MASFTGVGDNVELAIPHKGETVDIDLSGTYSMQIDLQREVGAPNSGAWEFVKTVSTTANATVADTYTSERENETIRLIVIVDTSGTCTATITDNFTKAFGQTNIKDPLGNTVMAFDEQGATLKGGLRFDGSSGIVDVTAATLTVDKTLHAGKTLTANRAAGVVFTLPAATGSGDVYRFFCGTTITSNEFKVAANGTDTMSGAAIIATDIAGVVMITGATTDYIAMNGTTTGGVIGSWVQVVDVAAAKWHVDAIAVSTGVEADPFGAT